MTLRNTLLLAYSTFNDPVDNNDITDTVFGDDSMDRDPRRASPSTFQIQKSPYGRRSP